MAARKSFDYRVIVVGMDFSEASHQALARAFDLAKRLDAQVNVIFVAGQFDPALPFSAANRTAVRELRKAETEQAKPALARLVARAPVPTGMSVAFGQPAAQIVRYAKRLRANLIVLGNVGHGTVERLLLGSTAQRVVQQSKIPVLLVPWTAGASRKRARKR